MPVVLIVDDDVDIVDAVSVVLQDEGHEVLAATTADEALAIVRTRSPCLTLVDYHMPGVDPAALVAGLRREGAGSIILCTASDAGASLVQRAGADGLLAKPFAVEDLLALLRESAASHPSI